MFNIIKFDDSIHTQNTHEVELRVRAREEQRFMQAADLGMDEVGSVQSTSSPSKASPAVFPSRPKALLQAMVGSISRLMQG